LSRDQKRVKKNKNWDREKDEWVPGILKKEKRESGRRMDQSRCKRGELGGKQKKSEQKKGEKVVGRRPCDSIRVG